MCPKQYRGLTSIVSSRSLLLQALCERLVQAKEDAVMWQDKFEQAAMWQSKYEQLVESCQRARYVFLCVSMTGGGICSSLILIGEVYRVLCVSFVLQSDTIKTKFGRDWQSRGNRSAKIFTQKETGHQ